MVQEITPNHIQILTRVRWIRDEYDISEAGESNTIGSFGYGCVIMVKRNAHVAVHSKMPSSGDDDDSTASTSHRHPVELLGFRMYSLPTNLGRKMILADLKIGPHNVPILLHTRARQSLK